MTKLALHKSSKCVTNNNNHELETWQISTWVHRAWLTCACTTLLISLAKSISLTSSWLQPISTAFLAYILSDLATGLYHWAIDNYGSPQTPIFGSQIVDFQSHHQQPWAITKRQFANNLYIPAATVTVILSPVTMFSTDPVTLGFSSVFLGCIMFSQQFHAWAHTPKAKLPQVVVTLQDAGFIVARAQHASHHRPPYNNSYCIVSGVWNKLLDRTKFFVALEVVICYVFGARARSWSDPKSEWTDNYQLSAGMD